MWRQKNAEENPSDSRKVWRIKQHLKLNKLEWNISAAIDSADTKIFWPLQECFVRLSTLSSSNGPAEALMLDRYFTICTEQECNKVCGPPGRRGRDTSETSLGRDVQRPVQPRLCPGCSQLLVLSEPPGRLSLWNPLHLQRAQLEVWEDAENQTSRDEGKHRAAVILAEVCWCPAGQSRRGDDQSAGTRPDQTRPDRTTRWPDHLWNWV